MSGGVRMAGPLLILYEMSIWIAKIFGKKPLDVEDEESSAESKA